VIIKKFQTVKGCIGGPFEPAAVDGGVLQGLEQVLGLINVKFVFIYKSVIYYLFVNF